MSLSRKSFKSDDDCPDNLPDLYSIFKGEVASVQSYGAFVKIPGCRKHGLVHVSQLSTSRVEKASDVCEAGERVYCKVISLEAQGSKIALSMKVVNQSTGQDLDPNQVQSSQESQKRRTGFQRDVPRIELGAIFDTTCKKCGGKGHLAQDCFHRPGETAYELIEDKFEWPTSRQTTTCQDMSSSCTKSNDKHKHKKEKKKKQKKDKKRDKTEKHSKSKDDKHSTADEIVPSSSSSPHKHEHHHRKRSHDSDCDSAANKNSESTKHSDRKRRDVKS